LCKTSFVSIIHGKKFPFYESEIEVYKNHIKKYYESIVPESFPETSNKYFILYYTKISLINTASFHNLTILNEDEFKMQLEETFKEVLNESGISNVSRHQDYKYVELNNVFN
jgi:hypothetical protein